MVFIGCESVGFGLAPLSFFYFSSVVLQKKYVYYNGSNYSQKYMAFGIDTGRIGEKLWGFLKQPVATTPTHRPTEPQPAVAASLEDPHHEEEYDKYAEMLRQINQLCNMLPVENKHPLNHRVLQGTNHDGETLLFHRTSIDDLVITRRDTSGTEHVAHLHQYGKETWQLIDQETNTLLDLSDLFYTDRGLNIGPKEILSALQSIAQRIQAELPKTSQSPATPQSAEIGVDIMTDEALKQRLTQVSQGLLRLLAQPNLPQQTLIELGSITIPPVRMSKGAETKALPAQHIQLLGIHVTQTGLMIRTQNQGEKEKLQAKNIKAIRELGSTDPHSLSLEEKLKRYSDAELLARVHDAVKQYMKP